MTKYSLHKVDASAIERKPGQARQKLFTARERRIKPARDAPSTALRSVQDGRLKRSYKDGQARLNGYLEIMRI